MTQRTQRNTKFSHIYLLWIIQFVILWENKAQFIYSSGWLKMRTCMGYVKAWEFLVQLRTTVLHTKSLSMPASTHWVICIFWICSCSIWWVKKIKSTLWCWIEATWLLFGTCLLFGLCLSNKYEPWVLFGSVGFHN